MICTVDASVFVSAFRSPDVNHADSLTFVGEAQAQGVSLVCPSLVLPECAGAIARPTGDPALARQAVAELRRVPTLRLISLTTARARRAAELAAAYRLRGADAVYVAVAVEFGATLITWDAEMLARGSQAVTVMTPTDWLAGLGSHT